MFTEDSSNKKLWSYIKSRRQENVGIGDLKNADNLLIRDPIQRANLIHNHFDSVLSNPQPPITANFNPDERLPDIHHIQITKPGILKLLLNINPKKADGPDGIPGRFLKMCAHELVDVYQILFQASLDQGTVPSDWKEADVMPLFKKGDKTNAGNYRPISLTSLSCKLLEHVVHSNIKYQTNYLSVVKQNNISF